MKLEIERRFLLKDFSWDFLPEKLKKESKLLNIKQYYLPDGTRLRRSFQEIPYIKGEQKLIHEIVNKVNIEPGIYNEDDKEIPYIEFTELLAQSVSSIEKRRIVIPITLNNIPRKLEVDIFESIKLVLAEIEYPTKEEFADDWDMNRIPDILQNCFIIEVTGKEEFSNKKLSSLRRL